jgi:hypothetical protein
MAVIREDRKYTIGPIGVARLSSPVPSSNGSQVIAEAVASAADNMADRFFREGAKKAEQFGIEQGSSASRETILAIDPATGAPKAYEAPKGFGTIAQDAYQRVILTRFQSSVEEEIRLKAKELAATYDGSVDRYTAAMSEYIGAMAVNADGQFQTYIQDVGTSYLNATRTAMAIDQINRERSAAANAQGASIAAGNDALRSLVASSGIESALSSEITPASTINAAVDVATDDLVKSELVTPEQAVSFGRDKNMALSTGQIEFLASKTTSSTEAMRLHAAISSGDLSLISDGPLQTIMSTLSYEDRGKLEKVSYDFLKERADYLKINEDEQAAISKAKSIVNAEAITRNLTIASSSITINASVDPLPAVLESTRESYSSDMQYSAQLKAAGRTEEASAYENAAKSQFDSAVVGVFSRTLMNSDKTETDAIERAVRNRNPSMAPAGKEQDVAAIIELENVRGGVIDSFGSFAQSHREDTGKLLTEQKELAAFVATDGLIKGVSVSLSQLSPTDLETTYTTTESAIMNSSMGVDKKLSLRKELAKSASIASLSNVFRFQQPPTPAQMNAMQTYISDGVDVGVLTPSQIEALNRVRKFQAVSEDPSAVTTRLEKYVQETTNFYTQQEKDRATARLRYDITAGQANGSLQEVRVAADDLAKDSYLNRPELGGANYGDLISNGSLFTDPKNASALNALGTLTVMPESVLQAFRGVSTGAIGGDRVGFVLRAWNELRFITDPVTGNDIFSPAVRSAMTADDIAKLDMMSGAYTMSGFSVEKVQEAINLYDNYKNNPAYKTKVEERLGAPLEVFVSQLDGIDGAMPQDVAAITAAALGLVGSSEITRITTSGIKDKLETQLNLSYPNDGNVMNGSGGLRSAAAPSAVLGSLAPQWNNFVLDYVKRNGFTIDGEKVSIAKMADLNDIDRMSRPSVIGVGVLGAVPTQSDKDTKKIFLQPVGSSTSDGTYYNVMLWRTQAEGGPVALRQEITISSPDGVRDGPKVYPVMTLNTKDPDFSRAVALNEARVQVEAQEVDERRRATQELIKQNQIMYASPIGYGTAGGGGYGIFVADMLKRILNGDN